REYTPRQIYQAETKQAIERFISSASANYRPTDWLSLRGNAGMDLISRNETQLCRFAECTHSDEREGFKVDNRSGFYIYTLDAGGTATRQINDDLSSETTAGVQFYRNVFTRNGAEGFKLPPGASTVTSGAEVAADETSSETRTLGAYVEQRLA